MARGPTDPHKLDRQAGRFEVWVGSREQTSQWLCVAGFRFRVWVQVFAFRSGRVYGSVNT